MNSKMLTQLEHSFYYRTGKWKGKTKKYKWNPPKFASTIELVYELVIQLEQMKELCDKISKMLQINLPEQRWKFYNPTCLNDDAVELAEAEIHAEDEKRFVIGWKFLLRQASTL